MCAGTLTGVSCRSDVAYYSDLRLLLRDGGECDYRKHPHIYQWRNDGAHGPPADQLPKTSAWGE